jgi:hypothetical protein
VVIRHLANLKLSLLLVSLRSESLQHQVLGLDNLLFLNRQTLHLDSVQWSVVQINRPLDSLRHLDLLDLDRHPVA